MVFPYQKKNLSMFPTTASYREKEKEKLKKFCISAQIDTVCAAFCSSLLFQFKSATAPNYCTLHFYDKLSWKRNFNQICVIKAFKKYSTVCSIKVTCTSFCKRLYLFTIHPVNVCRSCSSVCNFSVDDWASKKWFAIRWK